MSFLSVSWPFETAVPIGAAVAMFALAAAMPSNAAEACPSMMADAVDTRLFPVLQALNHARHQRGIWSLEDDAAFRSLLAATDATSAEARVALMDYYVGDGQGDALVCAVARDGDRSASWLAHYTECDIEAQRLPLPRAHASALRERALALIAAGDVAARCADK